MPNISEILAAKSAKRQQNQVTLGSKEYQEKGLEAISPQTIHKNNGEDNVATIRAEAKRPQESEAPSGANTNTSRAESKERANLEASDLLRVYSSLGELKASSVWKLLGIAERVRISREFSKRGDSGAHSKGDTHDHVQEASSEQLASETPSSSNHGRSFGDVDKYSEPRTILNRFGDFASLKNSELWKLLDISKKALIAREYSKQAQLAAIDAYRQQAGLESQIEEDKRAKALTQTALQPEQKKHQAFALDIILNEKQQLGSEYAQAGKSFVLTGAAGTGKTTACREMAKVFLQAGSLGRHTFKTEGGEKITSHGIAFCSYTRRATANIRRALHRDPILEKELDVNVVTVHRLLEFEPEFYVDLEGKNKMRFIPKRDTNRKLDIRVLVLEESSMLGLDLYEKLYAALQPDTILVFVGDINQLPPVFGKSIMNYALGQLPIIELTEVYRQALDSGVIVNAHRILKGESPLANSDTQLVTGTRKEHVGQEKMSRALGATFFQLWDKKEYDPEQDIILSPWNKQPCGTDNLNNWISQFLGEKRDAMIYEVYAGRRKMYLAIGDRVMYEKQDGIITAIRHNTDYLGKSPQPAGTDLTRFGMRKMAADAKHEDFEAMAHGYVNLNIDEVQDEEKKQQASHVVEITLDDGRKDYLRAIGDYAENVFSLGYVLTVHKSQGCEWRKVFIILHKDHTLGGFLTRELLYTAVTRAREKVIIIAKSDVLAKCVKQQTIKGNTLAEKIQSINSGAQNIGTYPVLKLSAKPKLQEVTHV